jgi:hypothetical protein
MLVEWHGSHGAMLSEPSLREQQINTIISTVLVQLRIIHGIIIYSASKERTSCTSLRKESTVANEL